MTNDIDIDQIEVLLEDLPKPEFLVNDKTIKIFSKKAKPNPKLGRIAKKTKKNTKNKSKQKVQYKMQVKNHKLHEKSQLSTN